MWRLRNLPDTFSGVRRGIPIGCWIQACPPSEARIEKEKKLRTVVWLLLDGVVVVIAAG